jgi:SAM-dependent methyltransferase
MKPGERQVAPTLSGVRRDHLARYEWAAATLPPKSRVVDCACGIGYGSYILAMAGHTVLAIDKDPEAIAYGNEYYEHSRITWRCCDAATQSIGGEWDAAICFETIEHIRQPLGMLREFRAIADHLIASVPNETIFPYENYAFHHRHYTRPEFLALLRAAGWSPLSWFGQAGPVSEVEAKLEGRTLIMTATPASEAEIDEPQLGYEKLAEVFKSGDQFTFDPSGNAVRVEPKSHQVPEHVTIVGLGPSSAQFFEIAKCLGGTRAYCDEVWGINAIGGVLACDRIFHMDDIAVQELRAKAKPDGNIAEMVRWLKCHPGPVYTSVVRPGYPGLIAFPLQAVLNAGADTGGVPYFNSTTAYAIAYAIHIGVSRISLFGVDYTQPNVHHGERGRACCEYWLGIAASRGIEVSVPDGSTLLDACAPERERLYGYDMVDVHLIEDEGGELQVQFTDREDPPTAEDVERAYDHKNVHTNRLLAAQ